MTKPKKPVKLPRKIMLEEVYKELQRGGVYECRIRDTKSGKYENCYGLSLGQKVFVDHRLSSLVR
mgnify:FL=1